MFEYIIFHSMVNPAPFWLHLCESLRVEVNQYQPKKSRALASSQKGAGSIF
jgi:hypothetical protein